MLGDNGWNLKHSGIQDGVRLPTSSGPIIDFTGIGVIATG
jgi:hypothetical protein